MPTEEKRDVWNPDQGNDYDPRSGSDEDVPIEPGMEGEVSTRSGSEDRTDEDAGPSNT